MPILILVKVSFREAACNNNTNNSDFKKTTVPPDGSHRHIGYKKGKAIASMSVDGLRSHLDEVWLLVNDLGIHIPALNETKLDTSIPKELTEILALSRNVWIGAAMEGVFHFMLKTF